MVTTNAYIGLDVDLELVPLIKPINAAKTAGEDLRLDNTSNNPYYQLQQLVIKARANNDLKLWQEIEDLALEILTTKSKDLEVASWLIESSVQQQGVAGSKFGCKLLSELKNRFGDDIYPNSAKNNLV